MNTTVYELKQYYVAAGGEAETVENITTIPDMIAAITALGAGGGGGSVLTINATLDSETQIYTLDKTVKEIKDAFLSGITCMVYISQYTDSGASTGQAYMPVLDIEIYENKYNINTLMVYFSATDENDYPTIAQ